MSALLTFAFCNEEEQVKQLKDYLKSLDAEFPADSSAEETSEELATIVDHLHLLAVPEVSEVDLEMVMNSVVSLMIFLPQDKRESIVHRFCSKLLDTEFRGKEAGMFRTIINLFNGFGGAQLQGSVQYNIYCTMLELACKSDAGYPRSMLLDIDKAKALFDKWNCSLDERRRCLRLLHAALIKGKQVEAPAKVMFELLSTYETEKDALVAEKDAIECIKSAINDPGTFIFDHLFRLHPVNALADQEIYELLRIFAYGSVSDYVRFYDSHQSFVTDVMGGQHEMYMHKMRILTLMTLGEKHDEISFEDCRKALEMEPEGHLEEFIIQAVQTKMIKIKIDQIKGMLFLSGAKSRSFGRPQWEQIRSKLQNWKESIRLIKEYMDSVVVNS